MPARRVARAEGSAEARRERRRPLGWDVGKGSIERSGSACPRRGHPREAHYPGLTPDRHCDPVVNPDCNAEDVVTGIVPWRGAVFSQTVVRCRENTEQTQEISCFFAVSAHSSNVAERGHFLEPVYLSEVSNER